MKLVNLSERRMCSFNLSELENKTVSSNSSPFEQEFIRMLTYVVLKDNIL